MTGRKVSLANGTHDALSLRLLAILESNVGGSGGLSMNEILGRTGGKGFHLVIILLCLPFVTPLTIPGLSGIFGSVLFVLSVRLALGLQAHLPGALGERRLPATKIAAVVKASVKILNFVEKGVKPRRSAMFSWRWLQFANGLLLAVMALILALPVPFGNVFPCYTIIFVTASMMEEDGCMIWLGYALALLTFAYCALVAAGGTQLFKHLL